MTPKHKKEELPTAPAVKKEKSYADPDFFPAGLAVFEFGSRPVLRYFNKEAPKIFGCTDEELKARADDLFPLRMKNAAAKQALEQAAETGEKLESTIVVEKSDASALWLFTSVSALKSGKKLVCSVVMYDVTLQRSVIRRLNAECEKNRLLRSCFSALTFEYDPIADIFTLDRAGQEPRVFKGFISRFPQSELIHKEDRAQFYWWLSLKEKAAESRLSFRADFDGSGYRRYNGSMAVICDKYGTPYHCTGVFQPA